MMRTVRTWSAAVCGTCLTAFAAPALAQSAGAPAAAPVAAPAPAVNISWGGYVKLDLLFSRYSDGAVAQGVGRDTYIPNTIPVASPGAENDRSYVDFHAKESRLFLKADANIEGHKLGAYFEMDFIVNQGNGNEISTNAYNPGLRRAYITYDNFLLGQDWTTFISLASLPEMLDFVAFPTDGTVFVRQPMVRGTFGAFQIAIENPESTVAPNKAANPAPAANTFTATNDSVTPDLVLRYNLKAGGADIAFMGLFHRVTDRGTVGGANDSIIGGGGSIAGKIPLGSSNDLRFAVNGGRGIGRYLALNTVGDAVVDANNELEAITIFSGYVAFHHDWNKQWRSNFAISTLRADTDDAAASNLGPRYTRQVQTAAINLLYSPVPKLSFGGELRYGERETVDREDGNLARIQFSTKYAF
jgi:hypothetical protein